MKIIHLSNSDIGGGASRAANRIHKALIKKSFESRMFVNKKTSEDDSIIEPLGKIEKMLIQLRLRIANVFIKLMGTKNSIAHSISFLPSQWVKRINDSDTDIVHLHWVQHEMLSIADIGKIKKPIVWTLHDMWAFCGAEHLSQDDRWRFSYNKKNRPTYESGFDINRWTWLRKLNHWQKPIHIVSPSNWLANCVRESKLMSNWPVSVVPNLLNTNNWKPKDKNLARNTLNLPLNIPLIIFGTLGANNSHHKGYDLLMKTLNNIKNDKILKNMELVVFGKNTSKPFPKMKFPIHYIGHLNDMDLINLYSAADATIIPSRQEAFCQTASESHACGTPVVAFNIGGLTDIVEHHKTGYLAKAFDTEDLAKGISWVLDEKNKKLLGEQARIRAVKKFSQQVVIKQYQTVYEKILNNKNET